MMLSGLTSRCVHPSSCSAASAAKSCASSGRTSDAAIAPPGAEAASEMASNSSQPWTRSSTR
eukprot:scaffold59653_cov57-Phaeocystis_antarctica.AAC.3